MTIRQNSLEGGTSGVTIDTANSGGASGSAFDQRTGAAAFSNVRAMHGTLSAYFSGSGATRYVRYTMTAATVLARAYVYYPTLVSGQVPIRINGDSGGPVYVSIAPTTGYLSVIHGTGIASSSTAFPTGQWVRVELYAESGAGTGVIRCAYYLGDSTTAAWDSGNLTGRTFAGNLYTNYGSSDTTTGEAWLDSIGTKSDADATWGAWPFVAPNSDPVVLPVSPQNVAAGATVTVNISATDDGTIASYASTVVAAKSSSSPTLSGASTATVTFTAPAAGNLVTGQTVVTDNLGAATTIEWEVRVPTTGNFTTLGITGTGGSWTNTGGAANDGAALADASDSTYSESPDYAGVESERRWRLQPISSRAAMTLTWRSLVTTTGGTKKARLYEGNTLRQEWTVTQSLTAADQTLTVTSPGSISDFGNLWVAEAVVS